MNTLLAFLYVRLQTVVAVAIYSIALAVCIFVNRPMTLFINQTADPNTHKVVYQVCAIQHRWGSETLCPPVGVGSEYQLAQFQLFQAQQAAAGWRATLNSLHQQTGK